MCVEGDASTVKNYINFRALEHLSGTSIKTHRLNSDLENISRIKSALIQEYLANKDKLKNKLNIGFRKYYYFLIAELSIEEHRILKELCEIREANLSRKLEKRDL